MGIIYSPQTLLTMHILPSYLCSFELRYQQNNQFALHAISWPCVALI